MIRNCKTIFFTVHDFYKSYASSKEAYAGYRDKLTSVKKLMVKMHGN